MGGGTKRKENFLILVQHDQHFGRNKSRGPVQQEESGKLLVGFFLMGRILFQGWGFFGSLRFFVGGGILGGIFLRGDLLRGRGRRGRGRPPASHEDQVLEGKAAVGKVINLIYTCAYYGNGSGKWISFTYLQGEIWVHRFYLWLGEDLLFFSIWWL